MARSGGGYWIPACAGMTGDCALPSQSRHTGESRYPVLFLRFARWIPACAGMTTVQRYNVNTALR